MMEFRWRGWLWLVLVSCQPSPTQEEQIPTIVQADLPHPDSIAHLTGEQLAYRYCQACHRYPSPDLLPRSTWQDGVLPRMGYLLGIRSSRFAPYQNLSMLEAYTLREAAVFPDEPRISEEGWQKIVDYYQQQAPDSISWSSPPVDTTLRRFQPHSIRLNPLVPPVTTLVHFDTTSHHLFVGDRRGMIYELDGEHRVLDSLTLDSPPSDLQRQTGGRWQVLTMGIMDPSDQVRGKSWEIGPYGDTTRLLPQDLQRPVHFTRADLNQDGEDDWIVSEFGNFTGQLAWYEALGNGQFQPHRLLPDPGARKTEVTDWNEDGRPDIVVLMAQGDERLVVLINRGAGRFETKTLLRFPPVYGSSYFELVDFNGDQRPDILYTNGDNADYSPVLKPYHGIRIFLQQADGSFQERFFFPLPGASKATARDFDQDGDLDIAAISFFPDFSRTPERGFLYLENQSDDAELRFSAKTLSAAQRGHWLTMDTGDTDQDGDLDIILGSFTLPPSQAPDTLKAFWLRQGPSFMILENQAIPQQ